jgi:hypothetical protein
MQKNVSDTNHGRVFATTVHCPPGDYYRQPIVVIVQLVYLAFGIPAIEQKQKAPDESQVLYDMRLKSETNF